MLHPSTKSLRMKKRLIIDYMNNLPSHSIAIESYFSFLLIITVLLIIQSEYLQ